MTTRQVICIDHGQRSRNGYGRTRLGGVPVYSHRKAYCLHHGVALEDIAGHVVLHTCDNPRCVEPSHLRLGSQADNMKDMHSKHRHPGLVHDEHYAAIRAEYVRGSRECGQAALAAKYGLSQTHVSRIINGT